MPDHKRKVGVVFSEEIIRRVKKYAQRNEVSRYEVIEEAVQEFLDRAEEDERGVRGKPVLEELDLLFPEALESVALEATASASLLQRKLGIGYARAARILDQLERMGYVSPQDGYKPRTVLVFKSLKKKSVN